MASLHFYFILPLRPHAICALSALVSFALMGVSAARAGGDPARTSVNQPVSVSEALPPSADIPSHHTSSRTAEGTDSDRSEVAATGASASEPKSSGSGAAIPDRTIRRPSAQPANPELAQPSSLDLDAGASSWRLGGLIPLVIVLGVMAGAYYFVKRIAPGAVKSDGGLLSVVSRAALSPRHSIALVRVGRRFVLVGISGDNIASLSEVTDEEEVADLVAASGGSRGEAEEPFADLLGGESRRFDAAEDADAGAGSSAAGTSSGVEIRERVAADRGSDRTSPLGLPSLAALRKKLKSLDARA